jgi:hypothetical protein
MAKGQLLKKSQSFSMTTRSRGGIVEFEKGQVREMRDAQTILGLISERGRKGLPLERVYRLLFNRELYLTAYGRIYRNAGAMTKGATEETVDEMSLQKIDAIIDAVRQERYRWTPVRRVYIEKKHSTKKRPLGIPICLSYCLSFQAMFGIPIVANGVDQKLRPHPSRSTLPRSTAPFHSDGVSSVVASACAVAR